MNELTLSITDLKSKVEKLVALHQQLKKDNEQLHLDSQNLQKTIDEQKITIESLHNEQKITIQTLEDQNKELIQSKNEEQNKIVSDTKLRINELVQEIDNCITLLK